MKNHFKEKPVIFFILLLLVYAGGACAFGVYSHFRFQKMILNEVDNRLLLAAKGLKYMLAPDFHDRARDKDSISDEEETLNRQKFSNYAFETNLEYLYTMVFKDGVFYFTAPTVTEEELKEREHWYFYPYEDAPPEFFQALKQMKAKFFSYTDRWGKFRSVALPQTSPGGIKYLSCADYDIGYLRSLYWDNLIRSVLTVFPLLLLTLPFILLFRSIDRSYSKELEKMNRELKDQTQKLAKSKFYLEKEIKEKHLVESSLRTSEEKLRKIFDTVQAGILIVDPANHSIVEVNEAACGIVEDTKDSIVGDVCHQIFCSAKFGQCPVIDRGETIENVEQELWTSDGRKKTIIKTSSRIQLGDREHILESFIDISNLKAAEQEKEIIEKQFRQAQKMEAVGTLAGGIAHDFNNLLQAINGYTQVLLKGKDEDSDDFKNLKYIWDAGNMAANLVRQLLLFCRKAETEMIPIEVNREIDQVYRILKQAIPKMIDIQLQLQSGLWTVKADPVQIEQILLNFGTNAADAMPDGGALVIETANVNLDQEFVRNHLGSKTGPHVLLRVSDTGQGMDRKTMEKIFEPFFTTKEVGKGIGLGLATVYGIVKSHGGYITCASQIGTGTVFSVYLPAMEQGLPVPDVEPGKGIREMSQGGTETILLVEDSESVKRLVEQSLREAGYTILTASSGEEALNIFSQKSDEIDLVVMDLDMPGMGGPNFLKALVQVNPKVKFLIASGYSDLDQETVPLKTNVFGFMGKPYQTGDLLEKVSTLLDRE